MRHRVLVIEDDRDLAEALCALIETLGHEVRVAHTGADGCDVARAFGPQVIFCDLSLPGMTGHETARALRSDPATAGARLIALSGDAHALDEHPALPDDFDSRLLKPIDGVALEALLVA